MPQHWGISLTVTYLNVLPIDMPIGSVRSSRMAAQSVVAQALVSFVRVRPSVFRILGISAASAFPRARGLLCLWRAHSLQDTSRQDLRRWLRLFLGQFWIVLLAPILTFALPRGFAVQYWLMCCQWPGSSLAVSLASVFSHSMRPHGNSVTLWVHGSLSCLIQQSAEMSPPRRVFPG